MAIDGCVAVATATHTVLYMHASASLEVWPSGGPKNDGVSSRTLQAPLDGAQQGKHYTVLDYLSTLIF